MKRKAASQGCRVSPRSMNYRITSALLTVLAAACIAAAESPLQGKTFIFPGSWHVERGFACPIDAMKEMLGTPDVDEMVALLQPLIPNVREELADPFVSEQLPFVRYEAPEPGRKIAEFYMKAFRTDGWKEGRDILGVEYTNSGGNWLRVFSRGTQQVLVLVCGSMERSGNESAELIVIRSITFRFRGIKPEELLGPHPRQNGRSEQ